MKTVKKYYESYDPWNTQGGTDGRTVLLILKAKICYIPKGLKWTCKCFLKYEKNALKEKKA